MHPGSSDPEQIDIDDDEERLMHHTHTNGVCVPFHFSVPLTLVFVLVYLFVRSFVRSLL